jgi:large subunit ribosomal protein L9
MAKTEVILTHNVVGLGGESDHVKVAAGYARNFLYPQGLAIPVTAANKRRLEVLRQRRGERESKELTTMTELGQALSKLTLVIQVKTGDDGKLFGSITAGTIADELKHQFDAIVDKRKIHLVHPIKNTGDHEVELRLHAQVQTTLKVKVESTTPPPAPVEAPAGDRREQGRGREGRREGGRTPAPGRPREEAKPEGKAETKTEGRPERKPRAPKAE